MYVFIDRSDALRYEQTPLLPIMQSIEKIIGNAIFDQSRVRSIADSATVCIACATCSTLTAHARALHCVRAARRCPLHELPPRCGTWRSGARRITCHRGGRAYSFIATPWAPTRRRVCAYVRVCGAMRALAAAGARVRGWRGSLTRHRRLCAAIRTASARF